MKLTWYGHSCFLMETDGGSIVFDPYAPGSVPGLSLPKLAADMVICSHEHSDHCFPEGVKLTGRETKLNIQRIPCFHDGQRGGLRGENLMTVVEADGLRAAHLGDLGHDLSEAQLEVLRGLDVLMLPVGGYYTIDAAQACKLAAELKPGIVIPMHYRGKDFGFDVIAPVEDFLALSENIEFFDTNVLESEKLKTPVTAVLKCPTAK